MTAILLSLILVSGYLFSINALPVRYRFKRSEGWGAYFFVAAWGVLFFFVGWLFCSFVSCIGIVGKLAYLFGMSRNMIQGFVPLSDLATNKMPDLKMAAWSFVSMTCAWLSGIVVGRYYNKRDRKYHAIVRAAKDNPIEELLIEASATLFPVIVTLKSKKIYVGWVRRPALEHGRTEFVSVIPLLSGFREATDLSVVFNTDYYSHYVGNGIFHGTSRVTLDHFRVVLPVCDIENISLFDFDTYEKFQRSNLQLKS